jgi:hypothetical protein
VSVSVVAEDVLVISLKCKAKHVIFAFASLQRRKNITDACMLYGSFFGHKTIVVEVAIERRHRDSGRELKAQGYNYNCEA